MLGDAVNDLKIKVALFEERHGQVTAIHLTAEMTRQIRWELNQLYGSDPGEQLTLLFGTEVVSQSAKEFKLE